ncbi:mediator of RNA polymerase II transcription subunit 13-like [Erpetoichthys calabaricus]|uniref:mediator of RNA polymerase II transcription subunit 13-like n=1 Tax=Erpetoichthys calabaricus TaxID=27687 RepID=UPI0022349EA0|nr:mediator of RNA polymerase II transcription subunit 13-like [Erpetoichthys calabaricus]
MAEGTEFRPPELHADRAEVKVEAATEGIALKRLFAQPYKRFKVSEDRVREHVQSLGYLDHTSVEGRVDICDPGDPYTFVDEDIEYRFTNKRGKGPCQDRDPSKKGKAEDGFNSREATPSNSTPVPDGKDAMSISVLLLNQKTRGRTVLQPKQTPA